MSSLRSEKPTAKRLRDLRKQGQIALSKEMSGLTGALGFFVGMLVVVQAEWPALKEVLKLSLSVADESSGFRASVYLSGCEIVLRAFFEIVIFTALPSWVTTFFQTKFLLAFSRIKISFDAFNVVQNLQNLVSFANVIGVFRQVVVVIVIVYLIVRAERSLAPSQGVWEYCGWICLPPVLFDRGQSITIYGFLLIMVSGYVDHRLQLRHFIKQNMMSKTDIKDEYKSMEGRPEIKSKRKQLHKDMSQRSFKTIASNSSVLVVNPTHVAVGLYYAPDGDRLPVITCKEDGRMAKVMKTAAIEAGIPIIERPALARALFRDGELDEEIPAVYIDEVAEVFRDVLERALAGESESEGW